MSSSRSQPCPKRYVVRQAHTHRPGASGHRFVVPVSEKSLVDPRFSSKLTSNIYTLRVTRPGCLIHQYQIRFTLANSQDGLPSKTLAKNSVPRDLRRLVVDNFMPNLLPNNSSSHFIIDSNGTLLYTLEKIPHDCCEFDKQTNEFVFRDAEVGTELISKLRVDTRIKFLSSFETGSREQSPTVIGSALHHQLHTTMLRYGSVYFRQRSGESPNPETRLDLIADHVPGLSISSPKSSSGNQIKVVISTPHCYMTLNHRLIDLLATFIKNRPTIGVGMPGSRPIPELETFSESETWFNRFCSIMEGYKCLASLRNIGLEDQILRFAPSRYSSHSAILHDHQARISVADYFLRFGVDLIYPNLPCLVGPEDGQLRYYPLELCSLLPNQKVPIFRLSQKAREHLVSLNKIKPDISYRSCTQARNEVENLNSAHFVNFGLELNRRPLETESRTLVRPVLNFSNQRLEPRRDFWESGSFCHTIDLIGNWCVINTVPIDSSREQAFLEQFADFCLRFGLRMSVPPTLYKMKQDITDQNDIRAIIDQCQTLTNGNLRFLMFIIDSTSTHINRLIHLSIDRYVNIDATCIRIESVMNHRQQNAIFRTLCHKINSRLGGTNVMFDQLTLSRLGYGSKGLMIVGLDVTHPDNELKGVSIVGCVYTYTNDLFKHKGLVWPQRARVEFISRLEPLMELIIEDYQNENHCLPEHIIFYRDGVSHEDFEKVRNIEISVIQKTLRSIFRGKNESGPRISFLVAQKRHTIRFFEMNKPGRIFNPPGGTIVDRDAVDAGENEFFLYGNTNQYSTARPVHYHVLDDNFGPDKLKQLTYFLCFNFGKCSATLTMPSILKYAHNAAYDARNRVILNEEFSFNQFYRSKFHC